MNRFLRRRRLGVAALALIGVLLLTPGAARADWFEGKVEKAVAHFVEVFNTGDAIALAELYGADAVVMAPNAGPLEGRAAIQEFWGGFFGAMSAFDIQLSVTAAERNGTLGYSRGDYTLSFTPQGGESGSEAGKYALVWKRGPNGKWQIAIDIWNSSLPPAGQ